MDFFVSREMKLEGRVGMRWLFIFGGGGNRGVIKAEFVEKEESRRSVLEG